MKEFFNKIVKKLENYIPMTFGSLALFVFVIYMIFLVSKSIINNHNSNKSIDAEEQKLVAMQSDIQEIQYEINYEKTYSYQEKEAREKLAYKAPGESVMSLPLDTPDEQDADSGLTTVPVKAVNYQLWWKYFFGS